MDPNRLDRPVDVRGRHPLDHRPKAIRPLTGYTNWSPCGRLELGFPSSRSPKPGPKSPTPERRKPGASTTNGGTATADVLGIEGENPLAGDQVLLHHPTEHTSHRTLERGDISEIEPLAVEILREGELVYNLPDLNEIRDRRRADLGPVGPGSSAPHQSPRVSRVIDRSLVGSQGRVLLRKLASQTFRPIKIRGPGTNVFGRRSLTPDRAANVRNRGSIMQAVVGYHRPESLEEALALLNRGSPRSVVLGGGTIINARESEEPFEVVDLQSVGLDAIRPRAPQSRSVPWSGFPI